MIDTSLLLLLSRRFLGLLFVAEVAAIAWVACVGGALQGELQSLLGVNDHVMHMAAFACAGLTAFLLWSPLSAAAVLGSGAMGVELAQRFIPGRDSSLADLAASLGGVAVGGGAALFVIAVLVAFAQPAMQSAISRD